MVAFNCKTQKELADKIGTTESDVSRRAKKGFSRSVETILGLMVDRIEELKTENDQLKFDLNKEVLTSLISQSKENLEKLEIKLDKLK